jgi:site-specific recombinase XerD
VEASLHHLVVEGCVSTSIQNQARSALLFLYREVLESEMPWLQGVESAKRDKRLPVVLTPEETKRLAPMEGADTGNCRLASQAAYGTGMCIMEWLRLRVKDRNFARSENAVCGRKASRSR